MQFLIVVFAPGGKTTHIAERLKGTGKVMSLDLHAHKVRLIKQQAERLGQKMSKQKR